MSASRAPCLDELDRPLLRLGRCRRPEGPGPRATYPAARRRARSRVCEGTHIKTLMTGTSPARDDLNSRGTVAASAIEIGDALIAADPQPWPDFDHARGRGAGHRHAGGGAGKARRVATGRQGR